MSMSNIDIPLMKGVVKHVMLELNKVPIIWGQPGAGKTEGVGQVLEANGALMVDLRLGQQDTVDLRGFPGIDKQAGSPTFGQMIWFPPSRLPFIGNDQYPDDRLIGLVLDEFNQATPQVMGGAYQLLQERRYGEFVLKPNVRIIAMANRETDRGIANRTPLPLCNRAVHYNLVVNVRAFCEYAMGLGVPNWLIAFWLFRSELVNTFDPEKSDKAFATPRTWFAFVDFVKAQHWPEDLRTASCIGAVGQGPAMEALSFREIADRVPKSKDILARPDTCDVPSEPSMQYAVCVKIAGEMTGKTAAPFYTYLKRMPPEFTVLGFTLAAKRDKTLFASAPFTDFSQRYRQAFSASAD